MYPPEESHARPRYPVNPLAAESFIPLGTARLNSKSDRYVVWSNEDTEPTRTGLRHWLRLHHLPCSQDGQLATSCGYCARGPHGERHSHVRRLSLQQVQKHSPIETDKWHENLTPCKRISLPAATSSKCCTHLSRHFEGSFP
jgi:hypothetical protein